MAYIKQTFSDWKLLKESSEYYHETLNPIFWDLESEKIDPGIRKKLVDIAKEFYSKYKEISKNTPIIDIQLTGSIANFNYTEYSDLDVHIIVDFSKIDAPKKVTKAAFDGLRFIWNLRHNIKLRGHEVEVYVQDSSKSHISSGLYSLINDEWIKKPKHNEPDIDDDNIDKKYKAIASEIIELEGKLISSSRMPSNADELFALATKRKDRIMLMRKEGLAKGGEFSVGNLVFKKLRNSGYIARLIDLISKSYDMIYNE